MKKIIIIVYLLSIIVDCANNSKLNIQVLHACYHSTNNYSDSDIYDYLYKNLPFTMPKVEEPVFPDNMENICRHGGVPDGITLNTDAFAKTIDELTKKGGGTVIVPKGIWLTGPIVLQSNINLHL